MDESMGTSVPSRVCLWVGGWVWGEWGGLKSICFLTQAGGDTGKWHPEGVSLHAIAPGGGSLRCLKE